MDFGKTNEVNEKPEEEQTPKIPGKYMIRVKGRSSWFEATYTTSHGWIIPYFAYPWLQTVVEYVPSPERSVSVGERRRLMMAWMLNP